jgi:hypothetical protein
MKNLHLGVFIAGFLAMGSIILIACGTSPPSQEIPSVFEKLGQTSFGGFETMHPPSGNGTLAKDDLDWNWYGWSVELESKANLDALPKVMNIYRITQPKIDYYLACEIAKQVGFNEPVLQHKQTGFYYIESSVHGRFPLIIYQDGKIEIDYGRSGLSSVPSDEDCMHIAENWLKSHDFYPTAPVEIIDVQTLHHIETWMVGKRTSKHHTATVVTFLLAVDGYEFYGMHLMVSIGDNGNIGEVYINVPSLEEYTTANLKEPELALDILKSYLNYPPDFFNYSPECQIDHIEREMTVTEATIDYFPNVNWPFIRPSYIQPVYIFKGLAYPESSDPYPFVARVDAVAR